MSEIVLRTDILPEPLLRLISAERVRVREDNNGEIRLIPVKESEKVSSIDYIDRLCGSLADYPEMSVDRFLERMRADKELEL